MKTVPFFYYVMVKVALDMPEKDIYIFFNSFSYFYVLD